MSQWGLKRSTGINNRCHISSPYTFTPSFLTPAPTYPLVLAPPLKLFHVCVSPVSWWQTEYELGVREFPAVHLIELTSICWQNGAGTKKHYLTLSVVCQRFYCCRGLQLPLVIGLNNPLRRCGVSPCHGRFQHDVAGDTIVKTTDCFNNVVVCVRVWQLIGLLDFVKTARQTKTLADIGTHTACLGILCSNTTSDRT
mgnify:FL=1